MKKFLALCSALCMLFCASISFAAEPVVKTSPTSAKPTVQYAQYQACLAAVRTEVPAKAVLYGYESDGKFDTLYLRDNDSYIEYKGVVENVSHKLTTLLIHGSNIWGSTTIKYTATGIANVIKQNYPDATNIVIETKKDGNNTYYEADFTITKGKVEAKLNPMTGAFGERLITYK